jgi:hypothetical protein
MQYTAEMLKKLREELYHLSKDAQAGKLDQKTAAEKIITLREEIGGILEHLTRNDINGIKK